MLRKITYRLTLVASLLLLSTLMPAIGADKSDMHSNDKNKALQSEIQVEKTNINQATNKELAAIKGIGTKKAQAIIDYREENGDFMDLNQLMKVKGIGQGTLKKITPYITL